MKFTRFLGIFPALFMLVMLFSGCDAVPLPDDGGNKPPTSTNNGSVYYAKADSTKYIFVSIYSEGTGKFITPSTSNKYALAIVSFDSDGDSDYSGPDSSGSIVINSGDIIFSPSDGEEPFTGKLSGTTITMVSVPETTYKNISLAFRTDVAASSSKPFGNNNSAISIPSGGNPPGGGTGGGGGNTGTTQGVAFEAGRHVINVEWVTPPPTNSPKTVYEGAPVELGNFEVQITYDDDSIPRKTKDKNEFIIDPPYYESSGGTHKLIFIGEYNTLEKTKLTFKAPTATSNDSTGVLEQNKIYYYPLRDETSNAPTVVISGGASIKYFPGFGESGLDTSGVTIKGYYTVPKATTANSNATETVEKILTFTARYETDTSDPKKSYAVLTYGKTSTPPANPPTREKKVELLPDNVYELDSIVVSKAPSFSQQITFDDPRFFDSKDKEKHWFSHMSDAVIGLVYKNTTTTKTVKVIEAAMYTTNKLTIEPPTKFIGAPQRDLTFKYMKKGEADLTAVLDVPVYDNLTGISIEPSGSGTIIVDATVGGGYYEMSFLRQVTVYAVYQKGANKNVSVKKPIFVKDKATTPTVVFNQWHINGKYGTNVNTDKSKNGILTAENSNSYEKNGKFSKAIVTFSTRDGSIPDTTPPPEPDNSWFTKSATKEIGVRGFGIQTSN